MVFLKEFVTNIIMKNIVIIILTGILICLILSYLFSRKNVEQFATNALNTDPKDYDESEKIIKEVAELTKAINKVEGTKPRVKPSDSILTTVTNKPESSKRLIELTNKINQSIDMSKYILKSKIKTCPKGPELSDYILKTKIEACSKPKDMSKYI